MSDVVMVRSSVKPPQMYTAATGPCAGRIALNIVSRCAARYAATSLLRRTSRLRSGLR